MVFLLALIPLMGSALLTALRDRPPRVRWATAVGVGALHLVVLTVMLRTIPLEGELTTWAPTSLFHGQILLTLDAAGWMLASSGAAVFTAYILFSAAGARSLEWSEAASAFAYLGLSLAAFLAGNLLTVALTWAAVDVLAYIYLLNRAPDLPRVEALSQQFVLRGASTLVIVAGGIPEAAGGGGPVTEALEVSVLSLAVWLRCGMWPIPPRGRSASGPDVLGAMDEYFPSAMALGALAHTLGGHPVAGVAWVWVLIGGINALFGGLRWTSGGMRAEGGESAAGLTNALGGLALLAIVLTRSSGGLDFAWWGAGTLVLGSLVVWPGQGRGWSQVLTGGVAALLLLGPGIFIGPNVGDLAGEFILLGWSSGSLIVIGSVLAAWGAWQRAQLSDRGGPEGEMFARGAALLGQLLPVGALLVILLLFGSLPGRVGAVMVASGIGGLAVLEILRKSLGPAVLPGGFNSAWRAFNQVAEGGENRVRDLVRTGETVIRIVGRVLEGSAALLWVFVVVLVVGLLVMGG